MMPSSHATIRTTLFDFWRAFNRWEVEKDAGGFRACFLGPGLFDYKTTGCEDPQLYF